MKSSINRLFERAKWELKKRSFQDNGEFANRIKLRERTFFPDKESEKIKYEIYNYSELNDWKTEKYWQRKLYNKINVWSFTNQCGVKTPKILWKGRDFETISFQDLPENFVLKPSYGHSSNFVYPIVNKKNIFDNSQFKWEEVIPKLNSELERNKDLLFFIEEFCASETGAVGIPSDYKFYCFNGQISCIQLVERNGPNSAKTSFYTKNWSQIPLVNGYFQKGNYQQPPNCLVELVEFAERLSKEYKIFCRIDFYATIDGAVLGELSPTPLMGHAFTKYGNDLLISYWDKYCENLI